MIGIEVNRGGRTWLLEGRETVVRLARLGQIGASDRVREERNGTWAEAGDLDWLAPAFEGDLWDAWDELDGEDPEEIWAAHAVPVESEDEGAEDTDLTSRKEMEAARRAALQRRRELHDARTTRPGRPKPPPERRPAKMKVTFTPAPGAEPTPPPRAPVPSAPSPPAEPAPRPGLAGMAPDGAPPSTSEPWGQVIAFPKGGGAAVAAEQPDVPPRLLQPLEVQPLVPEDPGDIRVTARPPPESRSWAPWLLVMALVLCLAAFALSIWHVQLNAGWTSARPVAEVPRADVPVAAQPGPEPVVEEHIEDMVERQQAELDALAAELRARIPIESIDLGQGTDDLANALSIELSNMKLGAVKVDAPVVSWTGARNDVPEVVDISVRLNSRGAIERELATVGMVVGKYLHRYGFTVRNFDIVVVDEQGIKGRDIDADAARNLWTGRMDLYSFLTGE